MYAYIRNCAILAVAMLVFAVASYAQSGTSKTQDQERQNVLAITGNATAAVVLSDESSTVRVAEPNELIGINGHVMRVDEFMVFLSANTGLVQRLRNLEMKNSSDSPLIEPLPKTHSDSPSPAVAPAAGKASPPGAAQEKR
jgi:hypothetical protein